MFWGEEEFDEKEEDDIVWLLLLFCGEVEENEAKAYGGVGRERTEGEEGEKEIDFGRCDAREQGRIGGETEQVEED